MDTRIDGLEHYLRLPYRIEIYPENGGYVAEIPDLPGCTIQGRSQEEALRLVEEAKAGWLRLALEDGRPIPRPGGGGVVTRNLHQRLADVLPLILEPHPDGGYTVTSPVLPGLVTEAKSPDEVLSSVTDALSDLLDGGDPDKWDAIMLAHAAETETKFYSVEEAEAELFGAGEADV